MTTRNRTGDSNEKKGKKCAKSVDADVQDGDGTSMRSAILEIIRTDEHLMNAVVDSVSQAIVAKFMHNPNLMDKLAQKVLQSGVLDRVKQELYESCKFDNDNSDDAIQKLESRVGDLESANEKLRLDSDAQEQYSRRNCLLLHGIPETELDTDAAVMSVCSEKLGVQLTKASIDRSHRLGYRPNTSRDNRPRSSTGRDKPRPIIIKLTSYDTRRTIFAAKRKLKGTKLVITENLTKTRAQLLKKAREMDNVEHAWTIDGRIVCLLRSGRKETVVNESELSNLRRDD